MDKLALEILAEVKRNPGKIFYPNDLLHLQSYSDIKMQMLWLYQNGYISGRVLPPSIPGIPETIGIEYIVYYMKSTGSALESRQK